jgi:HD-like signal output (HDOD) protein
MAGRRTTASIGKAQKLRFIAEKVIGLPTLPTVAAKLMELVDSPRTSAKSLSRLIEGDQVLTAKILKLANSVYYGMQRSVATVSQAVVVVGFDAVKDMGLSVSVLDAFQDPGQNKYFDLSKFWEHAISVGVGGGMLAKRYEPRYAGEAFTAGLLHDIGKVVINQYCHLDFIEIMERVHEDNEELLYAETVVLDTTHDRIGGWLADRWNMPLSIVEAIEFHHNPYLAEKHRPLVEIVKLADFLGRRAGIGVSGNKKPPELADEDAEYFKARIPDFGEALFDKLQMEFLLSMDQAMTFIDVIRNKTLAPQPPLPVSGEGTAENRI